jgi:hypothetical protein
VLLLAAIATQFRIRSDQTRRPFVGALDAGANAAVHEPATWLLANNWDGCFITWPPPSEPATPRNALHHHSPRYEPVLVGLPNP